MQRQASLPALTGFSLRAQTQAPFLTEPPAQLIFGCDTVDLSGFGSTATLTQRQAFLPALTGFIVRSHTQAPSFTAPPAQAILGSFVSRCGSITILPGLSGFCGSGRVPGVRSSLPSTPVVLTHWKVWPFSA